MFILYTYNEKKSSTMVTSKVCERKQLKKNRQAHQKQWKC